MSKPKKSLYKCNYKCSCCGWEGNVYGLATIEGTSATHWLPCDVCPDCNSTEIEEIKTNRKDS